MLDGLDSVGNMASDILHWVVCPELLHRHGDTSRGESATGIDDIDDVEDDLDSIVMLQVKYTKHDLNETKEERKQRKYRYLYQV